MAARSISWAPRLVLGGAIALALSGAPACMSKQARRAELMMASGDPDGAAALAAARLAVAPDDKAMRRIHVMALADAERRPEAAASYAQWYAAHGHDRVMLEDFAMLALRSRLGAANPHVRIAAIQAVEALQLDALADDVAKRMNDPNAEVAAYAAVAVMRGYADSIAALRDLIGGGDQRARAVVISGLARKVGASALPIVLEHAGDSSATVRREVASALANARAPAMRARLVSMVDDPDAGVVAAAISALGKSEACEEISLVRRQFLPKLATLVEPVARAILALPCARDPLGPTWVQAAAADLRPGVRAAAARAVAASPTTIAAIIDGFMSSPAPSTQRLALALRDRAPAAQRARLLAFARTAVASPVASPASPLSPSLDAAWLALTAADALAGQRPLPPADESLIRAAYTAALAGPPEISLVAATSFVVRGDAAAMAVLERAAAPANADAAAIAYATRAVAALGGAPQLSLAVVKALAADDERAVVAARAILQFIAR